MRELHVIPYSIDVVLYVKVVCEIYSLACLSRSERPERVMLPTGSREQVWARCGVQMRELLVVCLCFVDP